MLLVLCCGVDDMKLKDIFESQIRLGPNPLTIFKPHLVRLAQQVYDAWDEDDVDTYAHGGICHIIAEEFATFFNEQGFLSFTESSNFEQHVFTVVVVKKEPEQMYEDEPLVNMDEFYVVDISPYRYESGGGFSWCKLPDVEFDEHDISIEFIGSGEEMYSNFDIDMD